MSNRTRALLADNCDVLRVDFKPTRRKTESERFEALVDRSGGPDACHPFLGSIKQSNGYGGFSSIVPSTGKRSMRAAHKVAWEMHHGERVPGGLFVLHSLTCTTKRCCNPRHLRLGTALDNMADCKALGNTGKRLKPDQVLKIVALRSKYGLETWVLSERFGVTHQTINKILTGRTWAKLTGIELVKGKPGRPPKLRLVEDEGPIELPRFMQKEAA
jgi:hypothetical protein